MSPKIPNILTIAGSDCSGGAGIQADIKAISANGGYAMSVITALTAQNTTGVQATVDVPERFVDDQIRSIFEDIDVHAVKIGMLSNPDIIKTVAYALETYKPEFIILDPVMIASSGDVLISSDAVDVMKETLIPLATLITPNIPEAEKLSRKAVIDMERAAKDLLALGAKNVLLKGGHGRSEICRDILATQTDTHIFEAPRVDTENTHGTGCTLSSAIATHLGKGETLENAVRASKAYISKAIEHSDTVKVGQGSGPVHHFWAYQK